MFTVPALLETFGCLALISWIIYSLRASGEDKKSLEDAKDFDKQSQELLEYLQREKNFIHRMGDLDDNERKRMFDAINDSKK